MRTPKSPVSTLTSIESPTSTLPQRSFGRSIHASTPAPFHGVTRQNQWFSIGSGIELLDTPGVLWPKFDDPDVGLRLAFIGSVKDTILDIELIAARFLTIMNENYPERIKERYKLEFPPESEEFERLEMLARKRGMLISGGEPDTERAAVMLLDEYRAGKLGRITLD